MDEKERTERKTRFNINAWRLVAPDDTKVDGVIVVAQGKTLGQLLMHMLYVAKFEVLPSPPWDALKTGRLEVDLDGRWTNADEMLDFVEVLTV